MDRISAHWYIDTKENEVFCNLVNEMWGEYNSETHSYDKGEPFAPTMIQKIIDEAVKIKFLEYTDIPFDAVAVYNSIEYPHKGFDLIVVSKVLNNALKLKMTNAVQPEPPGTEEQMAEAMEKLKGRYLLVTNLGETGAEWSQGWLVKADNFEEANEIRKKNASCSYGYVMHHGKPTADILLRHFGYLSPIYWLDENGKAEEIKK